MTKALYRVKNAEDAANALREAVKHLGLAQGALYKTHEAVRTDTSADSNLSQINDLLTLVRVTQSHVVQAETAWLSYLEARRNR